MSENHTAHAIAETMPTSYSLAPLWEDIRADLRARRQARRSPAATSERHLYLVASNGERIARNPAD